MKITSVIVDDEPIARDVLFNYLQKYCPIVEVVGQAQHIKEAVPMIQSLKPQLVFLDVEMPYGNAFDVLEACEGQAFEVIFITAYSEYSLKALNMSAAYYILKPIDITELVTAVNKVQLSILKNRRIQPQSMAAAEPKEQARTTAYRIAHFTWL
jgi:two-component system LytT family response regulator